MSGVNAIQSPLSYRWKYWVLRMLAVCATLVCLAEPMLQAELSRVCSVASTVVKAESTSPLANEATITYHDVDDMSIIAGGRRHSWHLRTVSYSGRPSWEFQWNVVLAARPPDFRERRLDSAAGARHQ